MKTRAVVTEYWDTAVLDDGRLLLYMDDDKGGSVRLKMTVEVARDMVEDILDMLATGDNRCSRAYFMLTGEEDAVEPPKPSVN